MRALQRKPTWGNAGMIAPGHSFVWSSPKAPMILLRSLVMKNQALRFRPSLDPRLWTWSALFLAECTSEKARRNTLRKHAIAVYSQSVLHDTLAQEAIDYDRNDRGILYFYRDQASLDAGVAHMKILADDGQEIRVLDRQGLLEVEPALSGMAERIAGAIYAPTDESGSCNKFSVGLAQVCEARGAEIRTGVAIERIGTEGDAVTGVDTSAGHFTADAYVMALGCGDRGWRGRSACPCRSIRSRVSTTIPVGNHRAPPTVSTIDENNLVAISRMGDKVRVTATAEFAGWDKSHKPSDFAFMKGVAEELYPDGADYDRAEMWAGLRPMTPDNLPIIGRKGHRNLWYNTGHGHIGWTMSHGTARMVADLIGGRTPAMSAEGLAL